MTTRSPAPQELKDMSNARIKEQMEAWAEAYKNGLLEYTTCFPPGISRLVNALLTQDTRSSLIDYYMIGNVIDDKAKLACEAEAERIGTAITGHSRGLSPEDQLTVLYICQDLQEFPQIRNQLLQCKRLSPRQGKYIKHSIRKALKILSVKEKRKMRGYRSRKNGEPQQNNMQSFLGGDVAAIAHLQATTAGTHDSHTDRSTQEGEREEAKSAAVVTPNDRTATQRATEQRKEDDEQLGDETAGRSPQQRSHSFVGNQNRWSLQEWNPGTDLQMYIEEVVSNRHLSGAFMEELTQIIDNGRGLTKEEQQEARQAVHLQNESQEDYKKQCRLVYRAFMTQSASQTQADEVARLRALEAAAEGQRHQCEEGLETLDAEAELEEAGESAEAEAGSQEEEHETSEKAPTPVLNSAPTPGSTTVGPTGEGTTLSTSTGTTTETSGMSDETVARDQDRPVETTAEVEDEFERDMDMSDEEFEQKQADVSENSSSPDKKARKDQDLRDTRRRRLGVSGPVANSSQHVNGNSSQNSRQNAGSERKRAFIVFLGRFIDEVLMSEPTRHGILCAMRQEGGLSAQARLKCWHNVSVVHHLFGPKLDLKLLSRFCGYLALNRKFSELEGVEFCRLRQVLLDYKNEFPEVREELMKKEWYQMPATGVDKSYFFPDPPFIRDLKSRNDVAFDTLEAFCYRECRLPNELRKIELQGFVKDIGRAEPNLREAMDAIIGRGRFLCYERREFFDFFERQTHRRKSVMMRLRSILEAEGPIEEGPIEAAELAVIYAVARIRAMNSECPVAAPVEYICRKFFFGSHWSDGDVLPDDERIRFCGPKKDETELLLKTVTPVAEHYYMHHCATNCHPGADGENHENATERTRKEEGDDGNTVNEEQGEEEDQAQDDEEEGAEGEDDGKDSDEEDDDAEEDDEEDEELDLLLWNLCDEFSGERIDDKRVQLICDDCEKVEDDVLLKNGLRALLRKQQSEGLTMEETRELVQLCIVMKEPEDRVYRSFREDPKRRDWFQRLNTGTCTEPMEESDENINRQKKRQRLA